MITDELMRKQQLLEQEAARDQIQMMDQQLGVGPWGKSRSPIAQPHRDNLTQLSNDPQAFNRRLLEEQQQNMPNPFEGGGGGGGGGGRRPLQNLTKFSSTSNPTGAPSFMQTQKSKFPNPFS